MNHLPLSLRRYLFIIWAVGLLAWAASFTLGFEFRPHSWPLFALLLALLIVTQNLPQHILSGVKTSPNTIPLFIAVLCLPVSAAAGLALTGVAISHVLRRRPWCETGFNAASAALEVCVGGALYAALAHRGGPWSAPTAACVAAAALYLVNSSLVAGAAALQRSLPYGCIWRAVAGAEPLDHVLMFLVAGLVALPWVWMPVIAGLLLMGLAVRVLLTSGLGWLLHRRRIWA